MSPDESIEATPPAGDTTDSILPPNWHHKPSASILTLPHELQALITAHLPYPDLLSLKLSHPYFHDLFTSQSLPTVHQRIVWVISRSSLRLPIPTDKKVNFRTDTQFVQNKEVSRILRRRRLHLECEQAELSRKLLSLKFWSCNDQKQRLLCFVFEGQECPRLRDLAEKRALREKTLRFRAWRFVTWPRRKWNEWEREPWCPRWLGFVLRRFGVVGRIRFWRMVRDLLVLSLIVLSAGLATIIMHLNGITLAGLWHGSISSLSRWMSWIWEGWVQDVQHAP